MNGKNLLIGAATIGLLAAAQGCTTAQQQNPASGADATAMGECHGVNSCKATGDCGGKGYSCAGKNSCKGKGWLKMSQADCKTKDGKFVAN